MEGISASDIRSAMLRHGIAARVTYSDGCVWIVLKNHLFTAIGVATGGVSECFLKVLGEIIRKTRGDRDVFGPLPKADHVGMKSVHYDFWE